MELHVTDSAEAAASVAADLVARTLAGAVARRGRASVAFSGGTTPAAMLADLAGRDLPWAAIDVFQVDERIVPDGDPRRNAGLLDVLPVPPARRHLMPVTAARLAAAARRYAARLPERLDVVHLGLGDDGHTASWPPGDPVVEESEGVALCGEFNGTRRMTITPGVVNRARRRLVLAAGPAKADPLAGWLLHRTALPICRVHRTGTVVVVDRAAASALPAPQ